MKKKRCHISWMRRRFVVRVGKIRFRNSKLSEWNERSHAEKMPNFEETMQERKPPKTETVRSKPIADDLQVRVLFSRTLYHNLAQTPFFKALLPNNSILKQHGTFPTQVLP